MGAVPDAYYEFVMHYAPWFYVITTADHGLITNTRRKS